MTSQEARQQLDVCENQIENAYSNLQNTARSMGANTVQAARKETAMGVIFPLFAILLGFILILASLRFVGIVLILLGVYATYKADQTASSVQNKVVNAVSDLNDSLNRNSKI